MPRQRPATRTAADDDDVIFCAHGFLRFISLNQNPKLKYRNPETNQLKFKLRNPKFETGAKRIPKSLNEFVSHFVFWSFEIVSNFGFRVSNFLLPFSSHYGRSLADWPKSISNEATNDVQPVWWLAPTPAPVSPLKYSWNGT